MSRAAESAAIVRAVATVARELGVQYVQLGDLTITMAPVLPDVAEQPETEDEQYTATGTKPVDLVALADKFGAGVTGD